MVESGVGAGLWLNGSAHRGAHTNAGEFGHTVVQLDGPQCVCGRYGCLEVMHNRAAATGDIAGAARILAVGVVNLLQTLDVAQVVLAGADLLRHPKIYLDSVNDAVQEQVPRSDWLTVKVSLSGLGADVIAAGAAMQVLNAQFGIPDLAAMEDSEIAPARLPESLSIPDRRVESGAKPRRSSPGQRSPR